MYDIDPKYEVLYSDLRNLQIGDFLVSREFKLYMSTFGHFDTWKKIFDQTESERSYYSFGMDHEPSDASDTLGKYFNAIKDNPTVENLITGIINKFIKSKKEKTSFNDIIESAKISGFSEDNLKIIEEAISIHKKKEFPIKEPVIDQKKETKKNSKSNKDRIFIVHGHNEELLLKVARTIEKLDLVPIILHEQSNEGLTIIEKFEKHANVSFAVVLLTFDDFGYKKSSNEKNKRARQNVVLELGYFLSKLGRKNVLPLYEDGVELPSDISGVLYTKIDESDNWKFRLVKELKSVGFNVDANKLL